MTAIAVVGQATSTIEIGTAVVPIQTRHPIPMAQQALTTQMACEGRFSLGLGPSHHWIVTDQLGLPYEKPGPPGARLPRGPQRRLRRSRLGGRRERLLPGAQPDERHRAHADAHPARRPGAAHAPHRRRAGTGDDPLDGRREGRRRPHRRRASPQAASEAGRPAPRIVAGVPIILCAESEADDARSYAADVLGHAELSPNYERLFEHGDAADVSDVMAVGGEAAHPRAHQALPATPA